MKDALRDRAYIARSMGAGQQAQDGLSLPSTAYRRLPASWGALSECSLESQRHSPLTSLPSKVLTAGVVAARFYQATPQTQSHSGFLLHPHGIHSFPSTLITQAEITFTKTIETPVVFQPIFHVDQRDLSRNSHLMASGPCHLPLPSLLATEPTGNTGSEGQVLLGSQHTLPFPHPEKRNVLHLLVLRF